jgi:hypothetical protein
MGGLKLNGIKGEWKRKREIPRTSDLNSTNSHPRQSSSIIFALLGGEVCLYGAGGALMVAEDSLYVVA